MRRSVPLLATVLLATVPCLAQGPPASEPSAPHERLAFFEGTWVATDASPEDDDREVCAWQTGARRHMICRSTWQGPGGPMEGLSIFSFDTATGEYLYHGFRASGAVVTYRGRPEGAGWVFTSESGEGAARTRGRVTITPTESGFSLVDETASGDGPWQVRATVGNRRLPR